MRSIWCNYLLQEKRTSLSVSTAVLTLSLHDTKIVRWLKTKSEATPFDERFTEYFEDRDTKRMLREINGRKKLNALYKMQKGICPHCGEPITVERGFRIHTEVGADFKEKNVLLHADCHRELLI